ncbi:oligopeptide/dipeptide ABC transporter ATP-binding protein [Ferrovibrio sp.]|uniref:ABC transporter ATP-binding protein n=1 Tax=Ferrovibrio sp. TaxID=1917215 RepID=UPI001B4BEC78|nr:oligopeptide/dipeptide ABC transporter ATP-binding protein [Ferrovibrio sp.]MBP7066155.1 ATP-binding cassette domain-containing protein [Ferrovibrio sp.]
MAKIVPLLSVTGLKRYFDVSPPLLNRILDGGLLRRIFSSDGGSLLQRIANAKGRRIVRAVDGVDFSINKGETFSLVGESGCGKSTVARLIVGLYGLNGGSINFDGVEIGPAAERARHPEVQGRMQMIFQDPYASLNPRWRVGDIIAEPLRFRRLLSDNKQVEQRVGELLSQVGLSPLDARKFPHEFSGGQRQRISIARALAGEPEFLVCDEPTSALDVSVQAQILNLMKDLQRRLGLTYLFISHNLAVVYHVSDKVGVMYLGRLVEWADKRVLFDQPQHPYTRMLLDAIPDLEMSGRARTPVAGEVPSPLNPPSGCSFHPRCPLANARCKAEVPQTRAVPGGAVACHAVEEGRLPPWKQSVAA